MHRLAFGHGNNTSVSVHNPQTHWRNRYPSPKQKCETQKYGRAGTRTQAAFTTGSFNRLESSSITNSDTRPGNFIIDRMQNLLSSLSSGAANKIHSVVCQLLAPELRPHPCLEAFSNSLSWPGQIPPGQSMVWNPVPSLSSSSPSTPFLC